VLDLKGLQLGREGRITYIVIGWENTVACIDLASLGSFPSWIRVALENSEVTKVLHDCRADSDNLYHEYGIKLNTVIDTTVANLVDRKWRKRHPSTFLSVEKIVKEMCRPRGKLPTYFFDNFRLDVKEFKDLMRPVWSSQGRESVWGRSPINSFEQKYAALNCLLTLTLYNFYVSKWSRKWPGQQLLARTKEVSEYFVRAYEREPSRSGTIPEEVRSILSIHNNHSGRDRRRRGDAKEVLPEKKAENSSSKVEGEEAPSQSDAQIVLPPKDVPAATPQVGPQVVPQQGGNESAMLLDVPS